MDTTKGPASPWANGEEIEASAPKAAAPDFEPGSAQAIAMDMVEELEGCAKFLRAVLDTVTELGVKDAPKRSPETDEKAVMLLAGMTAKGHNATMNRLAHRMVERLEAMDPEGIREARESMGRPRSPFDGL